ncbi:MetI-like domain [Moorella glycerini]|uniref:Trehalose transport system permease protein SugA n=1 Tax=Neomoorella stamsii TaxID=1266720 RepID=A0A9X7J578_9FIRM|nr:MULTISPECIES: sugar ABC transporter permease [Moorella]PRR76252.1 Trehalose transport system permease protein SugA [Moorella stamsii]CEP66562.1 MetI-like domain [Moorella glycerini]
MKAGDSNVQKDVAAMEYIDKEKASSKTTHVDWPKIIFIAPAIFLIIALTLVPLFYTLIMSVSRIRGRQLIFVGIDNFKTMLTSPDFWLTLLNTVEFVIFTTTIEFVLGFIIAMLVSSVVRGQKLLRILFLLPLLLSPVAVSFMWKMMFNEQLGPITFFLKMFGLPTISWITSPKVSLLSIIIVDIWEWTPLVFVMMLSAIVSLPREPFESARVDGASSWRIFWDIMFPMVSPAAVATILIKMIEGFKVFDIPYITTGGGPGISSLPLTQYAYLTGTKTFNLGYAASISIFLLLVVLIMSMLFLGMARKYIGRRKIYTAEIGK